MANDDLRCGFDLRSKIRFHKICECENKNPFVNFHIEFQPTPSSWFSGEIRFDGFFIHFFHTSIERIQQVFCDSNFPIFYGFCISGRATCRCSRATTFFLSKWHFSKEPLRINKLITHLKKLMGTKETPEEGSTLFAISSCLLLRWDPRQHSYALLQH